MNRPKNPKWWDSENDSNWNRARTLMRKLNQIKTGAAKPYKELEPAHRFGFGARLTFGNREWDANFEIQLAADWRALTPDRKQKWEDDRDAILDGWNLGEKVSQRPAQKKNKLLQNIGPDMFSACKFADERLAA